MAYTDTKQAAVDPDNPAANEQIPYSEWNAMVLDFYDKLIRKDVDATGLVDGMILVYDGPNNKFVFEAQSAVGAINDLTDVTISGVPADNEVLAYDTGTSEWINQTAAEAGLATVTNLASYLALAGGTMAGNLNMGDYLIDDVDDLQAFDIHGVTIRNSAAAPQIVLATTDYAFTANTTANMSSQNIINVLDPTSAQHASTKNYDDTHLFTKEAVTAFTDGYIPVYRTASGKFEMEEQSAALGLPVADTTNIVKGSADGTKLMRFEVDGLTTGTTRVMTVPDKDITICGIDDALLNPATKDMDMANNAIVGIFDHLTGYSQTSSIGIQGGTGQAAEVRVHGQNHAVYPGYIRLKTTNAAKTDLIDALRIAGVTDTPIVEILYGLDMSDKVIADMKNSAPTALSGTQKDIEIDIGGTPYYFTVYPTKA